MRTWSTAAQLWLPPPEQGVGFVGAARCRGTFADYGTDGEPEEQQGGDRVEEGDRGDCDEPDQDQLSELQGAWGRDPDTRKVESLREAIVMVVVVEHVHAGFLSRRGDQGVRDWNTVLPCSVRGEVA